MAVIHIADWSEPVPAGRRQTILNAALDAGVPFPHVCGVGECGSCKCELQEGDVASDESSPDALSDDERARGLILACRSRPLGDVRLRWLSTTVPMPVSTLQAEVASVERLTTDVMLLALQLADDAVFDFRPGQFAKLGFGRLPPRSYSMATQPRQRRLEFHIRVLPRGVVSGHVANAVRRGDRVAVHGPFGDACWDAPPNDEPLLLLAGGTGLAPMLSVLDAALADGQRPDRIHLYHGVRGEGDLYAGGPLRLHAARKGFRFVPVYAQPQDPGLRAMHLHQAVAEDFASLCDMRVYVCGPPPMVDAVKALALERGAAPERIRADPFFAAEAPKRSLWQRITGAVPLAA
jgi:NAD(P)H-flavin reductase/ferredoxin